MIDFRYHIVSIIAIFLALGLGVVAGTTVLDRVTVDTLKGRVDDLRTRLNEHRKEITDLRAEVAHDDELVNALAPRVTEGALLGLQVLFVRTENAAEWNGTVQGAVTEAGAANSGSIVLTAKWASRRNEDRDALREAFAPRVLSSEDPVDDAAKILGELLVEDAGRDLITKLSQAGYISATPAEEGCAFPPPGAHVVVFAGRDDAPLAELARGTAAITPTLAIAGDVENLGAVAALRRLEDAPARLATFDSASEDSTGVGAVLALRAAVDGQGGHFGRASGVSYLPAPP